MSDENLLERMKPSADMICMAHKDYIALYGLALLANEGRWQPIETAPRDGTQFLITDGECVIMAEWANPEIDIWDTTCHQAFSDKSRITHWMPLPQPPKKGNDDDKAP